MTPIMMKAAVQQQDATDKLGITTEDVLVEGVVVLVTKETRRETIPMSMWMPLKL